MGTVMTFEFALLVLCSCVLVMAVFVNRRTKRYLDEIREIEEPKTRIVLAGMDYGYQPASAKAPNTVMRQRELDQLKQDWENLDEQP